MTTGRGQLYTAFILTSGNHAIEPQGIELTRSSKPLCSFFAGVKFQSHVTVKIYGSFKNAKTRYYPPQPFHSKKLIHYLEERKKISISHFKSKLEQY